MNACTTTGLLRLSTHVVLVIPVPELVMNKEQQKLAQLKKTADVPQIAYGRDTRGRLFIKSKTWKLKISPSESKLPEQAGNLGCAI